MPDTKSYLLAQSFIGKKVTVIIDRPIGYVHPDYGYTYQVNYGYVPDTKAPDGEELDAYYLGIDRPLTGKVTGICLGVIHRYNDDDDKLVVAPEGVVFTDQEIIQAVWFQEKSFQSEVLRH